MDVTATELKNRLGRYLDTAERIPVIVKKSGRAKSVIISHRMYERFLEMEDTYWAQKAREAEERGYLGAIQNSRFKIQNSEGSKRGQPCNSHLSFLPNLL